MTLQEVHALQRRLEAFKHAGDPGSALRTDEVEGLLSTLAACLQQPGPPAEAVPPSAGAVLAIVSEVIQDQCMPGDASRAMRIIETRIKEMRTGPTADMGIWVDSLIKPFGVPPSIRQHIREALEEANERRLIARSGSVPPYQDHCLQPYFGPQSTGIAASLPSLMEAAQSEFRTKALEEAALAVEAFAESLKAKDPLGSWGDVWTAAGKIRVLK